MPRYKKGAKSKEEDIYNPDKLRREWINPQLARAKFPSDAVLRSEYSRLRSAAMKRLTRMAGKPEAAETYNQFAEGFPTLAEVGKSRESVVMALSEISVFLDMKRNSISAIREINRKTIQTLQEHGINVNKQDLYQYGKFMNRIKRVFGVGNGSYGSQLIADAWNEIKTRGRISKKEYEEILKKVKIDIEKENRRRIGKSRRTGNKSFNAQKARSTSRRRR